MIIMGFFLGTSRTGPYFEGWYFKHQNPQGQTLALIPAFHIDGGGHRTASLQVISSDASWWLEYPEAQLQLSRQPSRIQIGQSSFSNQGIDLHIQQDGLSLLGAVHYGPFTILRSDIMGPFRFFPGMQCSHGIISMGHSLTGALELNGKRLDFSNGIGYIETDRGRSFPSAYLWTQCIWGGPEPGSLMLASATVPLSAGGFTGCICSVFCGGREYRLTANEGANTLHGGAVGFHKRLWDWEAGEEQVTFTLLSPDGEEGFPGNLQVQVRYTLAGSALVMDYRAKSDRDTVVNLSGHSYFNLAGHSGGRVEEHRLTLHAKEYTPAGPDNVPLGVLSPVAGTPLDFCAETPLGERLGDPFLQAAGGFDHNFALEGGHTGEAKSGAEVWCPRTGIALELRTTLPGLQLYTAGFLTPRRGKEGAVYAPGHAVCLEAQHFPDGINHPAFPSPLLRAGEEYQEQTVYRFSVR